MPLNEQTKFLDPDSRRRAIMDHIVQVGAASVDELAKLLGVSTMTIYRDTAELEQAELLSRKRGIISAAESSLTEASSHLRMSVNAEIKQKLAQKAAEYLRRGQSLMFDDSSSTLPLIPMLTNYRPITLITNAEFVANRARHLDGVKLLLTGGEYESWADAYFGDLAEITISRLRIDTCIMSSTALTATHCYHPNERVARLKRQMLEVSREKILLVDSSKFSKSALHQVCANRDFDLVITDSHVPEEALEALEADGVQVEIV